MMAESIEISNIRLTPVPPEELPSAPIEPRLTWYNLAITITNVSDANALHAIADVRRLRYDAARRVLQVLLSERDAPQMPQARGLPPPADYVVVAPGGETTIEHRLGSPLTFAAASPLTERPTLVRIPDDVDAIECIIAYSATPPPREVNLAALTPPPDLRQWGDTIGRTLQIAGKGGPNTGREPVS